MLKSWVVIAFAAMTLVACQLWQQRPEEHLARVANQFSHLTRYQSQNCEIMVHFAEPIKTAWLQNLQVQGKLNGSGSGTQLFVKAEKTIYDWSAAPSRCHVSARRASLLDESAKVIIADVEKKLDLAVCIWIQSFYMDSPLRGWQNHTQEVKVDGGNLRVDRGVDRYVVVSDDLRRVTAGIGPGLELVAKYEMVGTRLYPVRIEQKSGGQQSAVDEIVYDTSASRPVIRSFWLKLPDSSGTEASYIKAETSNCVLR